MIHTDFYTGEALAFSKVIEEEGFFLYDVRNERK